MSFNAEHFGQQQVEAEMELVSGVFSSWLMLAMKRVFVEFDTARPSASCCSSRRAGAHGDLEVVVRAQQLIRQILRRLLAGFEVAHGFADLLLAR